MTEEQWFAWDDPRAFLQSLHYQLNEPFARSFSERRLRLFAVACSRRVATTWPGPLVSTATDAAESHADARSNPEKQQLKAARRAVYADDPRLSTRASRLAAAVVAKSGLTAAIQASWYASYLAGGASERTEQERKAQGPSLRDIVGNPFRPATFSPEWRTSTAVVIAQGMHESRDFDAMPILSDALQDAGCEDETVLTHCRDPQQVHVRGCWVVDLVLGKA
ncbi:hypothetical protein [Gemmata sp.]|uniref:hypothetical protein n=1 Tax=Gemmata sp. TaxID=1914242 RepID=UPI003F6F4572